MTMNKKVILACLSIIIYLSKYLLAQKMVLSYSDTYYVISYADISDSIVILLLFSFLVYEIIIIDKSTPRPPKDHMSDKTEFS